jgi:hypothetical protein
MAEVKNSFIKSKMNKDLDARLLPNGEYREGINIQVSRSEGADVGALENVLGNELILNFTTLTGVSGLQSIGMYTNETSNNIYIFLTDFTDTNIKTITANAVAPNTQRDFNAASLNYYEGANNFICVYNTISKEAIILVKGAFLNFSTNNPIYSVNLLEDLLFFTDNRNQPRRINVSFANNDPAITSPTYYVNEDQISVASYNPYNAIDLYYLNSNAYNINGGQGTAEINQPVPGVNINLTADSLVGVNPQKLVGAIVSGTNITANSKIVSYIGNLLKLDTATTVVVTAGTVLTFNANLSFQTYITSMLDVTSPFLPDGTTINPNYNPNYSGDPDYLEDKFVRFSYRFKFIDGEVSIMAPFTQAAFIPKQDGYFLGDNAGGTPATEGNTTDEDSAYRSTVVEFMENKANQIILNIPLPTTGQNLHTDYKVDEIEILYKESDGLSVKIVDVIPHDGPQGFGVQTESSVTYSYQGVKPYKTLPESNLVRVYDKVPVRALTQEVISNRVVYGNFQNKHTPPNSLEFNVGIFDKYNFNIGSTGQERLEPKWYTSITEYPMHTVKQNRNYQVGIVLSDRYGRSSTTLLSSTKLQGVFTDSAGDATTFQGGTIYHAYKSQTTPNKVESWPGDSIKILFNQAIGFNGPVAGSSPNLENYWPGIYNEDTTSEDYNPLGWYSYKVVVKQAEQEYYNVYLPGILNGYPGAPATPPDPANTINFITLFGDNIDKVPADVTGVGPDQKQYRSGEQLYGRVTPKSIGGTPSPVNNTQFYPGNLSDTSIAIANQDAMLDTTINYRDIYQTATNPPLSRVNQSDGANPMGSDPQLTATSTAYNFLLGVYETAPVESVIDIYWETSSSGLISKLNDAINEEAGGIVGFTTQFGGNKWVYNHYEDIIPGSVNGNWFTPSVNSTYTPGAAQPYSLVPFYPYYSDGTPVTNSTMSLDSVIDGAGRDRTSEFQLNRVAGSISGSAQDEYSISITANNFFYYGANANEDETYTFTFSVTDITAASDILATTLTAFGSLSNIAPTITNCVTSWNNVVGQELIYPYSGTNGSADPNRETEDLTWAVVEQSVAHPVLTINSSGELNDTTKLLNGNMSVTISLTDAAGETATCTTQLNGSVGYRTLLLNNNFYTSGEKSVDGEPLIINKASESSGFYWTTSKDVNINGDQVPGANATPTPKPISRTPVPGLTMSTSLVWQEGGIGEEQKVVAVNNDWSWVNTNRTATSSVTYDYEENNQNIRVLGDNAYNGNLTFGEPIGLTEGTAYLIVDFEVSLLDGVALADAPGLIWPTYLQYRSSENANWEDATDIEGQTIKFGQTQINDWTISNGGAGPFNRSGVIDDRIKSRSTVINGDYDPENAAEAYNYGRPLSLIDTAASLTATCRQLVAVGMCQAYRDQTTFNPVFDAPDKIGDYRLTVRYPGGRNQKYSTTANAWVDDTDNNPALSVGYYPPSPYNDYEIAQQTQQVKLQFGDFYNPFQLSLKQNAISYAYRVSKQGNEDILTAQNLNPVIEVYAREWSLKYVSRFFLDARLTQPWEPGAAGTDYFNGQVDDWYYCFSASLDVNANAIYGTDYSNVKRESFPPYSDETNWTNSSRKWVGEFTSLGIKVKGTCIPLEYLKEATGTTVGPPNTGGGADNCGSAQQIMPNYYVNAPAKLYGPTNGQSLTIGVDAAIRTIPVGRGGITMRFEFSVRVVDNVSYYDSLQAAKRDSQNFCSQFIASGTPNFTAPNPISSAPVYLWRKQNQVDDLYSDFMMITFGKGLENNSGTPTEQLSELTYAPSTNSATFNSSSKFTVTITNCLITNTGSNGMEIKRATEDFWICNPNA